MLLLVGRGGIRVPREIPQEPDGHGENEDGGGHFFQILLALFPGMAPDGFAGGDAVGRELHHEREVIVLDEFAQDEGTQDGQHNAQQVDTQQGRGGASGEERAGKEHKDGQPSGAGHEGDDGDGDQAALAAFDAARSHDGRHIAAKAHHHGDKAFSVQANLMHQFIHDERRAGHVPAVLHDGYKEVQDHDVGQEHQHAAHAGNDAVHQEVPEPAVGQQAADPFAQPRHAGVDPVHRVLPHGEGGPENKPQQHQENRESRPLVGDNGVDTVCNGAPRAFFLVALVSLRQGALDEGVFGVYDSAFRIGVQEFLDAGLFFLAYLLQGLELRNIGQNLFYILVRFQEFDGQIAGGVLRAQDFVPVQNHLQALDALFQLCAVVNVDVAGQFGV